MEVAVSVAGEIIQLYQSKQALESNPEANKQKNTKRQSSKRGIDWQEFKSLVNHEVG
jgi:hypothetical protein